MGARNTLVSLPEALTAFQCLFSSCEFFCLAHCGCKWLLISSIFLSGWWYRWFGLKNPLFSLKTGSNPVETSGDDSNCISDTHHMWFIILRLERPRQNGLCIFSNSPMYMHGAVMTHGPDESVSSVCVLVQRGWWLPPLVMWHRKHLGPILTCAAQNTRPPPPHTHTQVNEWIKCQLKHCFPQQRWR